MREKGRVIRNRLLCMLLTFSMVFTGIPASVHAESGNDGPTASEVADAASDFAEAMSKFVKNGEDLSALAGLATNFSGLTAGVSGCIAILEMCGVIEDPTEKQIKNVLNAVVAVSEQLKTIESTLNDIEAQLEKVRERQEEINRQDIASGRLTKWQSFINDKRGALEKDLDHYNTTIGLAVSDWWAKEHGDKLWVLYNTKKDKKGGFERNLTYSLKSTGDTRPETADNGDKVTDYIRISPEMIAGLPAYTADTYRADFVKLLSTRLYKAIDSGALSGDEFSSELKEEWAMYSDEEKKKFTEDIAADALNTYIYLISCEEMSKNENTTWISDVMDDYLNFCQVMLQNENGLKALIEVQYNTHAFEGECKDDIIKACDAMIATAGYYGIFTSTIAGQCKNIGEDRKNPVRKAWVDTIDAVGKLKKSSIKGYDNYSYITNTLVGYSSVFVSNSMQFKWEDFTGVRNKAYISYDPGSWYILDMNQKKESMPATVGSVSAALIYYQYVGYNAILKPEEQMSFTEYLSKFNVGIPHDYKGKVLVNYSGIKSFSTGDALDMIAYSPYGDYFKTGSKYKVDKGNDVDQSCFTTCERVAYDYIDAQSGGVALDQTLYARAAYNEHHGAWLVDEGHIFYSDDDNVNTWPTLNKEYDGFNFFKGDCYKHTLDMEMQYLVNCMTSSAVPKSQNSVSNSAGSSDDDEFTPENVLGNATAERPPQDGRPPQDNAVVVNDGIKAKGASLGISVSTDEKDIEALINNAIDNGISAARESKPDFNLSDSDRSALMDKMKDLYKTMASDIGSNDSLKYNDLFEFADDDARAKFIARVAGGVDVPVDSVKFFAEYEPGFVVRFGEKDPVINAAYNFQPMMGVTDDSGTIVNSFYIGGEDIENSKLSVNTRVPLVSFNTEKDYDVVRYDSDATMSEQETLDGSIEGSGGSRYAAVKANGAGYFELKPSDSDTGTVIGSTDNTILIVFIVLICAAAIVAIVMSKRKKAK